MPCSLSQTLGLDPPTAQWNALQLREGRRGEGGRKDPADERKQIPLKLGLGQPPDIAAIFYDKDLATITRSLQKPEYWVLIEY